MTDIGVPASPSGSREPERWLPVVGYEGLYEVSDLGRIRSQHHGRQRILRLATDFSGYPMVPLTKAGRRVSKTVHRIVCRAFHGDPPVGKPEVAHKNGNRADARAANLRWANRRENLADRVSHGTLLSGERHPRAILSAADVAAIRLRAADAAADLADEFGVSDTTIRDVRSGRRWRSGYGETRQGLDPQDESAVPQADAQTPSETLP